MVSGVPNSFFRSICFVDCSEDNPRSFHLRPEEFMLVRESDLVHNDWSLPSGSGVEHFRANVRNA